MALSDQAKSGLESGVWIDGYDYQNKDKKHYHSKKISPLFFRAVHYSKNYVIPHHVIAAILDVILNILHR